MHASVEAFVERLARHDIKYQENQQPDGSHFLEVDLAGNHGKLYHVVMVFSADGMKFHIRCFQLGKVPGDRNCPMLRVLNDINEKYAWLRFYVNKDGDVAAATDAVITPESAARVCWEMLRCACSVLDEVQERIDKALKA